MPEDGVPNLAIENTVALDAPIKPETAEAETGLHIVAIGASAGGLEALMALVKALPQSTAAAFVVLQHMSPTHKSMLTELLSRETDVPVRDITDGLTPEPGVIYVTPPNSDVILEAGTLRLIKPNDDAAGSKPSVDRFFVSIAEQKGQQAVGIVLSGTGSDGAMGVRAIQEAGGVTIAQKGATAKFSGMPSAAMETGAVDLVLSPTEIGVRLPDVLHNRHCLQTLEKRSAADPLTELLQIIKARSRVDFQDYKTTTVYRRLNRRMTALGISDIEKYIRHCRADPDEIDVLFRDLLISVTQFFRDRAEFETLLPHIENLAASAPDGPDGDRVIRIWVAGCATGEEAYSIAMLMAETMGDDALRDDRVQIFATDIDHQALAKARRGLYPIAAGENIPAHLFERYVHQDNEMIEMAPLLRSVIRFSEHNLCQDPPFLNIDLICCRNLLIYFNANLQSKVLGRLHYSLGRNGLLFLGTAESVSVSGQLFRGLGADNNLYRKRRITRAQERARATDFSDGLRARPKDGARAINASKAKRREVEEHRGKHADPGMFEGLARALGPNSIVVTVDMRIIRVFGDISPYISLNEATRLQLSATMLRPPLNKDAHLLSALAFKNGEQRHGAPKRLSPDASSQVRMSAYPIKDPTGTDQLVLLTFTDIEDPADEDAPRGHASGEASERVHLLERDLTAAQDTLHQTIEELETSNDELQTLHEEMQTTNEELQATNAELETSNEELQSTNEELITVNEELQVSSMELNAVSDEQDAILENVAAALLIIDSALQVVKASAEAVQLFSITTSFARPHLSQIRAPRNFPSMTDICLEVIQNGRAITRDVTTPDGVYVMRCAPYTNDKDQILGATMIVALSGEASELQNMMLKESQQLMMLRDNAGDILRISEQSAKVLGALNAQVLIGRNLKDVIGDAAAPILREDREFLDSGEQVRTTDHMLLTPTGARRCLRMERYRYNNSTDQPASVYSIAIDVTDERLAKQKLLAHNEQLMMVSDIAKIGYWMIDLESGDITWSQEVYDIHGLSPEEFTPDLGAGLSFYHPNDRGRVTELVDAAMKDGEPFEFSARIVRPDGELTPVHSSCRIIRGDDGAPLHIVGVFSRE